MTATTIKNVIRRRLFGRSRYQPLWERLHGWALEGMNICASDGSIEAGEIWVLKFIERHLPNNVPAVVLDVGANCGDYSVEVLQHLHCDLKLFCFEPAAEVFHSLQKRMSPFQNVLCLPFGFSDIEESTTLYSWGNSSPMSSLYDRFQLTHSNGDGMGKKEEIINLKTIDAFCAEKRLDRVLLLKLDVEGHEIKVLEGAKRLIQAGAVDFIQFEFGGTNVDSRTFLHDFVVLLGANYRIYRILKDGLRPIGPYREHNEIFLYSNYLAVAEALQIHTSIR